MATRAGNMTLQDAGSAKVTWTGLLNGDDGSPFRPGVYGDMSIQALGTFGAGGTIILEGSNDGGTTWSPLTDPGMTAISLTAAGVEAVLQYMELIRPRVTAGDGTTSLTAILVMRKPK